MGAVVSLVGCASTGPPESSVVPVTDVKTVAGKWAGLSDGPGSSQIDYVELTIRDDSTYEVTTRRQIGTFRSNGKITLSNGQLMMKGEHGTGVATLMTRGSERTLRLDTVLQTNMKVAVTLKPSR
jgi:hypothetical protein